MMIGGGATIVGVLPLFLTGAMGAQLTSELAFGAAGLGTAVAMFRVTGALSSWPLGRLADRLGSTWSVRLTAAAALVALVGIATTARSLVTLVAWLMVGSCAHALGQPAANRLLIMNVRPERQGLAFGLKQSAQPTASMLAGLSVPLVAVAFGWRWSYLLGAVVAVMVLLGVGRRPPVALRAQRTRVGAARLTDRSTIVTFAVALGLSNGASATVSAFYVDAAVRAGSSQQFSGAMLAAASFAAIAARLGLGVASDRTASGHLVLCAGSLAVGSVGIALLATGRPSTMAAGVVIALGGAWGFNGVFWYALMRAFRDSPATVTGALLPGGLGGGTVGPLVFGVLAEAVGYAVAWGFAGVLAALAAMAMLFGARRLNERRRGQQSENGAGSAPGVRKEQQ